MNIKLNIFALTISLILLSCNNNSKKESIPKPSEIDSITLSDQEKENYNIEQQTEPKSEYHDSKIKIIDSKKEIRELDGNFNQMTLFEVNKDISLKQLKNYCSSIKPNYTDGYFQILVFFKKPNTAKFPDNPVTGMYMEDEDMKNIKAVYTINNMNGYSKLHYYNDNSFESLSQEVDIN
jgi:hypothetical protein